MSPEFDALRQIQSKHVPTLKTEIGAVLKAARLKKGLAVEAVARQTRISKKFLEALEADRFEEFPALVYLRGFMKGYCDFLEIDFAPLWAQVEAATAPPPPVDPNAPAAPAPAAPAAAAPAAPAPAAKPSPAKPAPTPAPAHAAPTHAAPSHAPASPANTHHVSTHAPAGATGATGAIAFSVVLAAGLGWWLFSHRAPAAPAPAPEPPKALQPLGRVAEPVLVLRFVSDAWVKVSLDGQPVFEGRAPRGSSQEWKPQKTLTLRTTSPEALALELDGAPRPLGAPGADGEYRIDLP